MAIAAGVGAGWVGAGIALDRAGAAPLPSARGWRVESPWPAPGGTGLFSAVTRAAAFRQDPAAFPADTLAVWSASTDEDGRALDGRSRYLLRVTVPAGAGAGFWTASVLDRRGDFFTGGGRPSLASQAPDLQREPDGSIAITLSATPPDDPAANWLPAPAGPFRLVFRTILLPRAPALPAIRRRDTAA